jgi:hypothetical protein
VRLSANCKCPERRSDDGQTILEGIRTGLRSCPDLVLLVEPSGLEPLILHAMPTDFVRLGSRTSGTRMSGHMQCQAGSGVGRRGLGPGLGHGRRRRGRDQLPHAYELATTHGGTGLTARLLPFTVDGLILAASMLILDASRRRQPAPPLARWCLVAGIAVTIGANLAHGLGHGPIGALVSAWPALALAGCFELLMTLIRTEPPAQTTAVPASQANQAAPAAARSAQPGPARAPAVEQTVRAWHSAGRSQRAIARDLGIDRRRSNRSSTTPPNPLPHQPATTHNLLCRNECVVQAHHRDRSRHYPGIRAAESIACGPRAIWMK